MRPFDTHTGVAAPLLRDNVDTDAIIPSREMNRVTKTGLGEALFAAWRYDTGRVERADFVLNQPRFRAATILLGGENFGC
ncbi:MAG: 3-isopropylmalate dehydratase small subunit, partial [Pseudomonadota bacterium]